MLMIYLKGIFSSFFALARYAFALVLAFISVYEGLALLSAISAVASASVPADDHLKLAIFFTLDLLIMLVAGYGSLYLFGVVRKKL